MLLLLVVACGPPRAAPSSPPNIVLLLADDLGWRDVGFHGASFPTPHIDRIAHEGLEFTRFYVTPWCVPTRAGLLTGRYAERMGIPATPSGLWTRRMPPLGPTLAEALAAAGYERRAFVGKWGLSSPGDRDSAEHPLGRGFTHFYGLLGGGVGYFSHRTGSSELDWHRGREPSFDEGYATDLIGLEAVRFIDEARPGEPFFLYVAFTAPHTPLEAKPEHRAKLGLRPEPTDPDGRVSAFPGVNRAVYSAMVTSMDENVGLILDALDRNDLARDTLVWFLSDNGGDTRHGMADNRPLRGRKGELFEGGVRVPSAVRWPAVVQSGRKVEAVAGYVDVFPTLAGLGGAGSLPEGLDGIDLSSVLAGSSGDPQRYLYLAPGALVVGPWKLVDGEVYRVDLDPAESRNLAELPVAPGEI